MRHLLERLRATIEEILHLPPSGDAAEDAPYAFRTVRRIPLYLFAIAPGLLGSLLALLLWHTIAQLKLELPVGLLVPYGLFPLVMMINSVSNNARIRYQRVVVACDDLSAATRAIVALISVEIDDAAKKESVLRYLIRLIRCLYGETVGQQSKENTDEALDDLARELKRCGLLATIIGPNGRMHLVLGGTQALVTIRETHVGRGDYASLGILFLISYAQVILCGASLPTFPMWIGVLLAGLFTYSVTLIVLGINDMASPFGTGKISLSRASLFSAMEKRVRYAMERND